MKPNNSTTPVRPEAVKPNKLDTLIDLIEEIETTAYCSGASTTVTSCYKYDRKLAKAKTKAFKIINSLIPKINQGDRYEK